MRTIALTAVTLIAGLSATPAFAESFFFTTGTADGRLGALSQPPSAGKPDAETADDFILNQSTILTGATITGLIPADAPLSSIQNVEVEVYHVFPRDSDSARSPSVPTRMNSPADVEIDDATRDSSQGTLSFEASLVKAGFSVANTVVRGINKKPANVTLGEGAASGQEVEIDITFTPPIILATEHYFLRPEAQPDGSFRLISSGRRFGEPGFYRMVEAGAGHWRVRYIRTLRESFHVYVDRQGTLRTDHVVRFLGLRPLRLHYKLERTGPPSVATDRPRE